MIGIMLAGALSMLFTIVRHVHNPVPEVSKTEIRREVKECEDKGILGQDCIEYWKYKHGINKDEPPQWVIDADTETFKSK